MISMSLFIGTIIFGAIVGAATSAYSSINKGDEWYEVVLKTLCGAALGGMLNASMGIGASLAVGCTIAGLSMGASIAVGIGISVLGSSFFAATNSFVNQIIDNDWDISKVNGKRIGTDALVGNMKGLLCFTTGAWTGGAGLWNIPKGSAPGFSNLLTRILLNGIIGTTWKFTVDVIYSVIMGEECEWIESVREFAEEIF